MDTQHRITDNITPISFSSVDELARLKYVEREDVQAQLYIGNPIQTEIARFGKPKTRRRIVNGVDKEPFTQLIREVL